MTIALGLAEIGSALGSLKTASDIVKTFSGLRTDAERNTKLVELQGQILAAQTGAIAANAAQMALIEQVRDLEKQIAGLEAWESEKQRYELKRVSYVGGTAYVVKPDMRGSEPPHCICGACYDRGKKGRLQPSPAGPVHARPWVCSECKSAVVVTLPLPGYTSEEM
jgi:hypothetical protein